MDQTNLFMFLKVRPVVHDPPQVLDLLPHRRITQLRAPPRRLAPSEAVRTDSYQILILID
jgi:hypothetical protein